MTLLMPQIKSREFFGGVWTVSRIKEFDFIAKSTKGMEYARCKVCGVDFSVSNGGRCDVTNSKHSITAIHSKSMEFVLSISRLISFIARLEIS